MLENMQLFGFYFLNENKIFKLNILVIIIYEMKNNGDKSLLINDVLVWFMDQEYGKLLHHIFIACVDEGENEMFILLGQP